MAGLDAARKTVPGDILPRRLTGEPERVFLAYALPCMDVCVAKGEIEEKGANAYIAGYAIGFLFPEDIAGRYFGKVVDRCAATAAGMGKSSIDAEAIRHYFWCEHDRHVDEEFAEKLIEKPDHCRVWPGSVKMLKHVEGRTYASVLTPRGKMFYDTELAPGVRVNDFVAVHRAFVSEIIDRNAARSMLEAKNLRPDAPVVQ